MTLMRASVWHALRRLHGPSNKRLERTGGQPTYFVRAAVAAGRSAAGR
jgi:hypothetical protein